METHCCAGYLKLTNVQNVHQTQFIVANNVQQNGIHLAWLLVE
jgi:hypothetical protein